MTDYTPDMVRDDPAHHRFAIALDGDDLAAAYYRRDENGRIVLTHTEVPSEYGGRGIASTLARGVFDIARSRGDRLVLKCPFMAAWFAKHTDYADVVAG
ncbi:MAG: GNAT family N-acetyltransferase [Rhodoblastus sp.]